MSMLTNAQPNSCKWGPVYVTVGDGGNREKLYDKFDTETWSAYHNGDHYGYGNIRI